MLKLNFLFPLLFLLFHTDQNQVDRNSKCDLIGDWSQVTLLIEPLGDIHKLVFEKEHIPEADFTAYAQQIHCTYTSGQGNIDIDQSPTLSFSKNKISYKGEKLGRYKMNNDCKTIELSQIAQTSPKRFASCTILYRYENIIAMKQGDQTVFYLRRYPKNPFFVGE
ncbi:MAG: hypothetical protein AB8F74_11560 [Saprospiraceae bacterium]